MKPTTNNPFLQACEGKPVSHLPVWMMRQAGRYLPEYRELRARYDFVTMYRNPELAIEVTLQPLRRFPLDAAIIFSDILVIPEALGMAINFTEEKGPQFAQPLEDPDTLLLLTTDELQERLHFVFQTLQGVRAQLNQQQAVIGFSGAPWTLAVYMIEGGSSRNFTRIKQWRFQHPKRLHRLLERLTDAVADYLILQANAGADALQLFDSWVGILDAAGVETFVLPYVKRLIHYLKQHTTVPIIYFPRGGMAWLSRWVQTGADVIGVDWAVSLKQARQILGNRVGIQGNLDPAVLLTNPTTVEQFTQQMLTELPHHNRYIVNLGHGILPTTPIANAMAFVETVKKFNPRFLDIEKEKEKGQ